MTFQQQQTFTGKYERLQFLGKGTFGSAYKIRDKKTSQILAAKFISLVGMSQKQILKADEQRLIHSQLSHPNILKFCESYLENQTLIFVMQYCEYGDLQMFLRKRKEGGGERLPQEVVMNIFLQLLFGLQYLHSQGIIHRDLKPSNIFVDSKGQAKIADFGISKVLNPATKLQMSTDSSSGSVHLHLAGTPMYASPEVCRNEQITYKSDTWSIGCILYQLCTLKPAFQANNILALATKINTEKVSSIGEEYSEDLAALVQWMLEKTAEQRPNVEEILGLTFIKKYIKAFENQRSQHTQESKYITPKKSSISQLYTTQGSLQKSSKTADSSPTYAIIYNQSDLVDERSQQQQYFKKLRQSCINLMGSSLFNQMYHELRQLNDNFVIVNEKDRKKINKELMKIYGQQYYDLAKAVLELVENQSKHSKMDIHLQNEIQF